MHSTPHPRRRRGPYSNDPHAPLSQLRRRYAVGGAAAVLVFLAAVIINILRGAPGDDAAMLGVEVGASAVAVLCGVVAIMSWIITEHAVYLTSLWALIENMRSAESAGMARGPDRLALVADDCKFAEPAPAADPIPIQRGLDAKRQREGRHAV